eukprot:gene12804-12932_t
MFRHQARGSSIWRSIRAFASRTVPVFSTAAYGVAIAPATGPLVGIKVLDFGQVAAGNFCGAILGYFGADVIKVEPPKGDALRSLRHLDYSGTSLWWRCNGRNKRCITLDLHKEEARDIARRLADKADVLVENFRPGVMEKWRLGPSDLNPHLVYTRISGFGQTGPKAREPGYASVCEAYGGFRHLNGYTDRPPVRPNISLGDNLTGLHAAFGTVMALLHKQRVVDTAVTANAHVSDNPGSTVAADGLGQVVDASISESMFNMLEACVCEVAMAGDDRQPSGSTISGVVPSGTFETIDHHYVVIGGNGDSVYSRLMVAIDRPDMVADSPDGLYRTNSDRVNREADIIGAITGWVKAHTLQQVMEAMSAARVPAGPILSTAELMQEDQYIQRGLIEQAPVLSSGEGFTMPAILPKLSKTPGRSRWAGPELGEHTMEILQQELGLSNEDIQTLRDAGAV